LTIVQARLNSKRFPKKVLYKVNNKPLIYYLIKNLQKTKKKLKIIIATSTKKTDDELVKYCKKNKIIFFRGKLNNVAHRLLSCAKKYKAKHFIRICADSPIIKPCIIDKIIKLFSKKKKYDLITNLFPRTFEKGQSIEIIKTKILDYNLMKFDQNEKEHVTKFFYKNYKKFKIFNLKNKFEKKNIDYSVDTKKNLELLVSKNFFL
jgi:spore coat polysaccharide biosynthesis protein SpsF